MTYDAIRKAFKADPFRPFFICLTSGQRLHAPHPEMLLVPPVPARTIVLHEDGGYHLIDLTMVSALEFENEPKRRRRAG